MCVKYGFLKTNEGLSFNKEKWQKLHALKMTTKLHKLYNAVCNGNLKIHKDIRTNGMRRNDAARKINAGTKKI